MKTINLVDYYDADIYSKEEAMNRFMNKDIYKAFKHKYEFFIHYEAGKQNFWNIFQLEL